nr:MAG TPA: hypothetical protein [Caudoviricetes sp.]
MIENFEKVCPAAYAGRNYEQRTEKVLDALRGMDSPVRASDIAKVLGITTQAATKSLHWLMKLDLVAQEEKETGETIPIETWVFGPSEKDVVVIDGVRYVREGAPAKNTWHKTTIDKPITVVLFQLIEK